MTIAVNKPIYYKDLTNYVLNWILTNCKNINAWDSSVSAAVKNGYNEAIAALTTTTGRTFTIRYQLTDALCSVVTTATVTTEFNQFLTEKGLSDKLNQVVTSKGILEFITYLVMFLTDKVRVVKSQIKTGDTRAIIYVNKAVSSADLNIEDNNIFINNDDVLEVINTLSGLQCTIAKTTGIPYTITYTI